MGLTKGNRTQLTLVEKMVKDNVAWLQGLFYQPAAEVAGLFEDIKHFHMIYQENKVLKETLARYALDIQKLNELEIQNKSLKDVLGFTERQKQVYNYVYRIAEVVSIQSDPYNQTVSINLGKADGIRENMAVVTIDGLVGRIDKVSNFSSTVQLLTNIHDFSNESKAIAATIKGKETQSFGMIEKYDKEKEVLVMRKVDQADPVDIGDVVITSGLGKVFPQGIEIGQVISIESGEYGITRQVNIQPKASFRFLKELFVIEIPETRN
jgi:rod shape-determining protein MreC